MYIFCNEYFNSVYLFFLFTIGKKKCDSIECVSIMNNTHFVDAVDMRQKFVAYES